MQRLEYSENALAAFPHIIQVNEPGLRWDHRMVRWCEQNVPDVPIAPHLKSKRWEAGYWCGVHAFFFYNKADAMAFKLRF